MEQIINTIMGVAGVSTPMLIALLAITLIYTIYGIVTGKGVNLSLGKFKFGFSFDKKTKDEVTKPIIQCEDCSKKDLYVERAKSIVNSFSEEQNSLKKDLLLQQMNYSEEKISELRILLCKQYSKAISQKLLIGIAKAKEHTDYKSYRMLIYYILLSKVKDGIIKKALKENHFLDLSNVEFDHYINRKTDLIIDVMSDGLDTYYFDSTIISREELFILNEQILHETKAVIRAIFENARNITETYLERMTENKETMERKLTEI